MRIIGIYHVNIYGFLRGKYENFNMFTFLPLHDLLPGKAAVVFADQCPAYYKLNIDNLFFLLFWIKKFHDMRFSLFFAFLYK